MISEYEWSPNLRFVRIYFDTPTFHRITKDRAAKFVDMLSAIVELSAEITMYVPYRAGLMQISTV